MAAITVELRGDAAHLNRTLSRVESRFGGFNRGFSGARRLLGGMLAVAGRAAIALGGIAAIGIGLAAKGGMGRLMGLEDANARLKSLGISGKQTKRLMDSVNDTLLGTAFSLDEGAAAVTGFVASGLSISEVERRFKLLVDTAAFAQAPLGEIESIFGQIQNKGKALTEEIQQLQERGVPAFQILAAGAGVSVREIQGMLSEGEISAGEFFDYYEKGSKRFGENNVSMEGAAKDMGDTTRGAWANMMTALNRFGARMLEGLFPQIKDALSGAGDWFDDLADRLGPIMDRVWETVGDVIGDIRRGFELFFEAFATGNKHYDHFGDAVETSNEPIARLAGILRSAWDSTIEFFDALPSGNTELDHFGDTVEASAHPAARLAGALKSVWDMFGDVWRVIEKNVIPAFREVYRKHMPAIWDALEEVRRAYRRNKAEIDLLLSGIKIIIAVGFKILISIIGRTIDAVATMIRWVGRLIDWWGNLIRWIKNVIDWFRRMYRAFNDALADMTSRLKVWGFVLPLLFNRIMADARDYVKARLDQVVGFFKDLPNRIKNAVSDLWAKVKASFSKLFSGFTIPIKIAFGLGDGYGMLGMLGSGGGGVLGAFGSVVGAYKALGSPGSVISGLRPGARTLSGSLSYHAMGRALDITPIRAIALAINRIFGSRTLELITPWQDLNLWHGRPHAYSGVVYAQHSGSNAHIHWAMAQGAYLRDKFVGQVVMAERHPEIVAPEPMLREIVRAESGGWVLNPRFDVRVYLGSREITDVINIVIDQREDDDRVYARKR